MIDLVMNLLIVDREFFNSFVFLFLLLVFLGVGVFGVSSGFLGFVFGDVLGFFLVSGEVW